MGAVHGRLMDARAYVYLRAVLKLLRVRVCQVQWRCVWVLGYEAGSIDNQLLEVTGEKKDVRACTRAVLLILHVIVSQVMNTQLHGQKSHTPIHVYGPRILLLGADEFA